MKYKAEMLLWEFTMGCNLRCLHCGSSCKEPLPDELSTEESMALVDQIILLKPRWITLTGGEPLLRCDWDLIASKLNENGISVRMITNGVLINEKIAQRMKACGLDLISISLDGTEEFHDYMRGKGAFKKSKEAYKLLKEYNIPYSTNTTIIRENIDCLEELSAHLIEMGVSIWQLQPGLPEGSLANHRNSIINASDFQRLIDFSFEENKRGKIKVLLGENIGYFTRKESLSRSMALGVSQPILWKGCNAGIRSLAILHNGDVVGCTSIRKPGFVEGNIRNRSLTDIWNHEDSFAWRRKFTASKLKGACRECTYCDVCLGGCSNVRLTLNNSLSSENQLCVYNDYCKSLKS